MANNRYFHICVDIRGLLKKSDRELKGWITDDSGKVLTPKQARRELMLELDKGRLVLPTAPCEGFDYQDGCPGHEENVEGTINQPEL